MNPTLELPRGVVDAIRLVQVVLVALTPFLPVSTAVQAVAAVLAAVVPLLVVRQAVVPVVDA